MRAGLGPAAIQAPLLRAERLALFPIPGLDVEIGRQAELLGDLEGAIEAFERAAKRYPEDPAAPSYRRQFVSERSRYYRN